MGPPDLCGVPGAPELILIHPVPTVERGSGGILFVYHKLYVGGGNMAVAQDDHWIEAQKRLIKEAFALFDKDKKGKTQGRASFQR